MPTHAGSRCAPTPLNQQSVSAGTGGVAQVVEQRPLPLVPASRCGFDSHHLLEHRDGSLCVACVGRRRTVRIYLGGSRQWSCFVIGVAVAVPRTRHFQVVQCQTTTRRVRTHMGLGMTPWCRQRDCNFLSGRMTNGQSRTILHSCKVSSSL